MMLALAVVLAAVVVVAAVAVGLALVLVLVLVVTVTSAVATAMILSVSVSVSGFLFRPGWVVGFGSGCVVGLVLGVASSWAALWRNDASVMARRLRLGATGDAVRNKAGGSAVGGWVAVSVE